MRLWLLCKTCVLQSILAVEQLGSPQGSVCQFVVTRGQRTGVLDVTVCVSGVDTPSVWPTVWPSNILSIVESLNLLLQSLTYSLSL